MTAKDFILAVVIPVILAEMMPWCGWLGAKLLPLAARLRYGPGERAGIRAEEWESDLTNIPGQICKLAYSLGQLTVGSIVARRRKAARPMSDTEIPYTRLGFRIFGAILVLTSLMIAILGVFAWITYPSAADAHAVLGSSVTGPAALNDWHDMQVEWFDQVMRLAQFLIFGSVLPLLATVVGYLLAQRWSA